MNAIVSSSKNGLILTHAARFLFSILSAALITGLLFTLMYKLIERSFVPPSEAETLPIVNIWMESVDPVEPEYTKPKKPDVLEAPPKVEFHDQISDTEVSNEFAPVDITVDDFPQGLNVSGSNIPIAHLLKQPKYPQRALMRGIEGWVDLKFDINALGKTQNIQVLGSEPEGVFEKAAVAAVRFWKYQAFVNGDGDPQEYKGLTKRLVFEIED